MQNNNQQNSVKNLTDSKIKNRIKEINEELYSSNKLTKETFKKLINERKDSFFNF